MIQHDSLNPSSIQSLLHSSTEFQKENTPPFSSSISYFPLFAEDDKCLADLHLTYHICDAEGHEYPKYYIDQFPALDPSHDKNIIYNIYKEIATLRYLKSHPLPEKDLPWKIQFILSEIFYNLFIQFNFLEEIEIIGSKANQLLTDLPWLKTLKILTKNIKLYHKKGLPAGFEEDEARWQKQLNSYTQSLSNDDDYRFLNTADKANELIFKILEKLSAHVKIEHFSLYKNYLTEDKYRNAIDPSSTKLAIIQKFGATTKDSTIADKDNYFVVWGLETEEQHPIDFIFSSKLKNRSLCAFDSTTIPLKDLILFAQKKFLRPSCAPFRASQSLLARLFSFFTIFDLHTVDEYHWLKFITLATTKKLRLPQEKERLVEAKLGQYKNLESYLVSKIKDPQTLYSLFEKYFKHHASMTSAIFFLFNGCTSLMHYSEVINEQTVIKLWELFDKNYLSYSFAHPIASPYAACLLLLVGEKKYPFNEVKQWLSLMLFLFHSQSLTKHNGTPAFRFTDESCTLLIPFDFKETLNFLNHHQDNASSIAFELYKTFSGSFKPAISYYEPYLEALGIENHMIQLTAKHWMEQIDPVIQLMGLHLYLNQISLQITATNFVGLLNSVAELSIIHGLKIDFKRVLKTFQHLCQMNHLDDHQMVLKKLINSELKADHWIKILAETRSRPFLKIALALFKVAKQSHTFSKSTYLSLFNGWRQEDIQQAIVIYSELKAQKLLNARENLFHFNALCRSAETAKNDINLIFLATEAQKLLINHSLKELEYSYCYIINGFYRTGKDIQADQLLLELLLPFTEEKRLLLNVWNQRLLHLLNTCETLHLLKMYQITEVPNGPPITLELRLKLAQYFYEQQYPLPHSLKNILTENIPPALQQAMKPLGLYLLENVLKQPSMNSEIVHLLEKLFDQQEYRHAIQQWIMQSSKTYFIPLTASDWARIDQLCLSHSDKNFLFKYLSISSSFYTEKRLVSLWNLYERVINNPNILQNKPENLQLLNNLLEASYQENIQLSQNIIKWIQANSSSICQVLQEIGDYKNGLAMIVNIKQAKIEQEVSPIFIWWLCQEWIKNNPTVDVLKQLTTLFQDVPNDKLRFLLQKNLNTTFVQFLQAVINQDTLLQQYCSFIHKIVILIYKLKQTVPSEVTEKFLIYLTDQHLLTEMVELLDCNFQLSSTCWQHILKKTIDVQDLKIKEKIVFHPSNKLFLNVQEIQRLLLQHIESHLKGKNTSFIAHLFLTYNEIATIDTWTLLWEQLQTWQDQASIKQLWKSFQQRYHTSSLPALKQCWISVFKTLARIKHPDLLNYLKDDAFIENMFKDSSDTILRAEAATAILIGVIAQLDKHSPNLDVFNLVLKVKLEMFINYSLEFEIDLDFDCSDLKPFPRPASKEDDLKLLYLHDTINIALADQLAECPSHYIIQQLLIIFETLLSSLQKTKDSLLLNALEKFVKTYVEAFLLHPNLIQELIPTEFFYKLNMLIDKGLDTLPFDHCLPWMNMIKSITRSSHPTVFHHALKILSVILEQDTFSSAETKALPSLFLELYKMNTVIQDFDLLESCLKRGLEKINFDNKHKADLVYNYLEKYLESILHRFRQSDQSKIHHAEKALKQYIQWLPFLLNNNSLTNLQDIQPLLYLIQSIITIAIKPISDLQKVTENFSYFATPILNLKYTILKRHPHLSEQLKDYIPVLLDQWKELEMDPNFLFYFLHFFIKDKLDEKETNKISNKELELLVEQFIFFSPLELKSPLIEAILTRVEKIGLFADCLEYLALLKFCLGYETPNCIIANDAEKIKHVLNKLIYDVSPIRLSKAINLLKINIDFLVSQKQTIFLLDYYKKFYSKVIKYETYYDLFQEKSTFLELLCEITFLGKYAKDCTTLEWNFIKEALPVLTHFVCSTIDYFLEKPLQATYTTNLATSYIHLLLKILSKHLDYGKLNIKQYIQQIYQLCFPRMVAIVFRTVRTPSLNAPFILDDRTLHMFKNTLELLDLTTKKMPYDMSNLFVDFCSHLQQLSEKSSDPRLYTAVIYCLFLCVMENSIIVEQHEEFFKKIKEWIQTSPYPYHQTLMNLIELNFYSSNYKKDLNTYFATLDKNLSSISEHPILFYEHSFYLYDRFLSLITLPFENMDSNCHLKRQQILLKTIQILQQFIPDSDQKRQVVKRLVISNFFIAISNQMLDYASDEVQQYWLQTKKWLIEKDVDQYEPAIIAIDFYMQPIYNELTYCTLDALAESLINLIKDSDDIIYSRIYSGILMQIPMLYSLDRAKLFVNWMKKLNLVVSCFDRNEATICGQHIFFTIRKANELKFFQSSSEEIRKLAQELRSLALDWQTAGDNTALLDIINVI